MSEFEDFKNVLINYKKMKFLTLKSKSFIYNYDEKKFLFKRTCGLMKYKSD